MKRAIFLIFLFVCSHSATHSQIINQEPLSDRITGYMLDVTLDPVVKTVKGTMDAYRVNRSADTVPDVRMHLYMNAFRNNKSTFFKESDRSMEKDDSFQGWIEITSLTDKNGTDLSAGMQFISPDDGNPDDKSVIRILLPGLAYPGDTVSPKISFVTKLPLLKFRKGYRDGSVPPFPSFPVIRFHKDLSENMEIWKCDFTDGTGRV